MNRVVLGVGPLEYLGEVHAVHVGDERAARRPGGEGTQRLDSHRRPQVRATDPDVDHQPEALAGATTDATAAHFLGEREHACTLAARTSD